MNTVMTIAVVAGATSLSRYMDWAADIYEEVAPVGQTIDSEKPNNPATSFKDPVSGNKRLQSFEKDLDAPTTGLGCSLPGSFSFPLSIPASSKDRGKNVSPV